MTLVIQLFRRKSNEMIKWAAPDIGSLETEYVLRSLESTWISGGTYHDFLESRLSTAFGGRTVLLCSNGTSAIQMAYQCLGLRAGDEVIVPGFGYLAAANVAMQFGMIPRFADVSPSTWCLTADSLKAVVSSRTKAIVGIHTYGSAFDVQEVVDVANHHGVPVIEDCAESFGSSIEGRWLGTFGAIATLSFQATKNITTGEGGGLVSSDESILRLARLYRSHGVEDRRYWHILPGNNYRLTNMQSALGCAQLERFEAFKQTRLRLARLYRELLGTNQRLQLQEVPSWLDPVPWTIGVRIKGKDSRFRDLVIARLAKVGIETRPGFYTPNQLPGYGQHQIQNSDDLASSVIVLPLHTKLTDANVKFICECLMGAM